MVAYHDEDWGVPVHDDCLLFELLTLEGAQAGLSWITILKRRDNYRKVFDGFEIDRIAAYTSNDIERRLTDVGIIRNRSKVQSTLGNARAALEVIAEWGSLDSFFWDFVDGHTGLFKGHRRVVRIHVRVPRVVVVEQLSSSHTSQFMASPDTQQS